MSYIQNGSCSVSDVKDFIGGKEITVAYAKDKDNLNVKCYDFWSSIRHPETGEVLHATKGYCNPENLDVCYYAEYLGADGSSYYYLDSRYYREIHLRENKSISSQQDADSRELEDKESSKKHSDFFKKDDKGKEQSGENNRKEFFESSGNKLADDKNQSFDSGDGNKNDNSHFQGE